MSARTRGAKVEPRYDSRLYRWFEAKIAMVGMPPQLRQCESDAQHSTNLHARPLEHIRYQPCLRSMVERGYGELELVCEPDYIVQIHFFIAMVGNLYGNWVKQYRDTMAGTSLP